MKSHSYNVLITANSKSYSYPFRREASQEVVTEEAIPDSSTDLELSTPIDVSEVVSFLLVADQDVTVKVNDSITPDETINLTGNTPVFWYSDDLGSFFLTNDVTNVYVTNSSGSEANLTLIVLQDATP